MGHNVHFVLRRSVRLRERKLSCGNSFEVMSGKDVYVARLTDCGRPARLTPRGTAT